MGLKGDVTEDHHEIVRSGYDVIADEYLARVAIARDSAGVRAGIEKLISELRRRVPPSGTVLDLGCGAGMPFTASLAQSFEVTGVDFSARQLELARQKVPSASFVHADMTEVKFPAAEFNAVTAFFSIIHVHRDRHQALFENISEWLKPGGVFVASLGKRGQKEDRDENWLGAPMFWSYHNPEIALQQIEQARMRVERSWLETVEEGIDGPETFFWVVASKY